MDTLTIVLDKSTVGTTDVMNWIDTHGFPTNYRYLQIVNNDKSDGLLVSISPILYEQSALVHAIDLGIVVPWQSKKFPNWKRVHDSLGWSLIKETTIYAVTQITGNYAVILWEHLIKDWKCLIKQFPNISEKRVSYITLSDLPNEIVCNPYYVKRFFIPLK